MTILTRQTAGTGVSSKNAPLTHAELDQNFIELTNGNLVGLNVSSNISLTNANLYSVTIDSSSAVPWSFSVRTVEQLALTNNVVNSTAVVFVPDLTNVANGTTYVVETFGQLTPIFNDKSIFQYDKNTQSWETVAGN